MPLESPVKIYWTKYSVQINITKTFAGDSNFPFVDGDEVSAVIEGKELRLKKIN